MTKSRVHRIAFHWFSSDLDVAVRAMGTAPEEQLI